MFVAIANVPTASASRYLQQLCKHWAHNMAVSFDANEGRVVFPKNARGAAWSDDGNFRMSATPTELICTVEASESDQLEGLKSAVERHLNRFAFKEGELVFDWQSPSAAL